MAKISYWPSTKDRYANWEATLEPVHLDTTGEPFVADADVVLGPNGKPVPLPIPLPYLTLTQILTRRNAIDQKCQIGRLHFSSVYRW